SEAKCLKRGVKEVVKSIRRGNKGLCVIAGNISPIDVITHVPILCEEANVPYVYVPSKEDLATAGTTKRPTCCVLVLTKPNKGELSGEISVASVCVPGLFDLITRCARDTCVEGTVLSDGSLVAVKRLKDGNAADGEAQFQTELEMISLAVHRNLLQTLWGFCMTSSERLLVYPYMSNGSVALRLKEYDSLITNSNYREDTTGLDHQITRKRIALGAARGLPYLHEQCDPKIIHRDVKAANILLDDCCEAVVGDFGLAKLLDHRESHVTTAVRGTVGHIAPEYLSAGQSSEKTDVFGFGILLLELITGQTALAFGKSSNQKGTMLDW
ncbi:hypothetical protein ACJX0J_021327, partial [Zea mays]